MNPFEVLRLDPTTPTDEIVRHAGRLRQQAASAEELRAIRQAVAALIGPPEERVLHEVLTWVAPQYRWPELDRIQALWRRPPSGNARAASLDWRELADMLARRMSATDATRVTLREPTSAEELARLAVEACFQALLTHPGA